MPDADPELSAHESAPQRDDAADAGDNAQPAGGDRVTKAPDVLKKKIGPLPLVAWAVIGVGAGALLLVFKKKNPSHPASAWIPVGNPYVNDGSERGGGGIAAGPAAPRSDVTGGETGLPIIAPAASAPNITVPTVPVYDVRTGGFLYSTPQGAPGTVPAEGSNPVGSGSVAPDQQEKMRVMINGREISIF